MFTVKSLLDRIGEKYGKDAYDTSKEYFIENEYDSE